MCRNGFAMNVVAAKRRGQNYSEQADVKRLELDELLSVSDFVVLSCPLTAQTEGLIDKPELSKMKRSAYLINVARGRVINTNARSEEHTSELQSLMSISYAVFCLKQKKQQ